MISNKKNKITYFSLTAILILLIPIIGFAQKSKATWSDLSLNRNKSFYDIQKDFKTYWQGKKVTKGIGYKVFKRWEALMKPRVFPSGDLTLASKTYPNFLEWKNNNRHLFDKKSLRAGNWTHVGPPSKPTGYDAGVGRVDFVRFDPTNSNTMYVSTPDGGLWKTTNGNAALPNWTTKNDYLAVIGCSDLAIHPTNPSTMYLATGSWESDKKSIGVLKTVDGGANWTSTSLVLHLSEGYVIRRLIMDPTNPLIMLAATDGGVYRTTDGWATNSLTGLDNNYNINDIKFKPGDNMTVYATGRTGLNTNIFWKSSDNGVTWTAISSGLPPSSETSRVIMGVSVANSNAVYVLAGNIDGGYKGLYFSSSSGVSFTTKSTTPNILNADYPSSGTGGQASHDLAIAVSPIDIDLITVGGISQFRSTDGGENWNILTFWYGTDPLNPGGTPGVAPYLHADVQSIEYLPGSSTTIFATCDGSISRSTDNGLTWSDISNDLQIAQQTDVALSSDDAVMITGLQDIGNLKNTNGVWTYIGGGDGESAFIDRTNNLNIVVSDPNGNHSLSVDGGLNKFSLNDNGLPPGTEFFSPIIQDPVTSTTCYAGGRPDLYKSTNYLDAVTNTHTWTSIGTPSGTGSVTRFVIYPSDPMIIYTLKENAVSKTTNGGSTWTNVTGTLPLGVSYPSNIAISNTDPNRVWVVFSGYTEENKVFKTIDGGTTWTNVNSTSLPNIPINTIVYRNNDVNDAVYIGADIGIFYHDNSNPNWVPYFNDMANSKVTDLEIYYPGSKIRASTYGRGLWESKLYDANEDCSLMVSNTADDGPGSLRRTIACALDGATITFDASLTDGIGDDTIKLTSGPIRISKNINIHQELTTIPIIKADATGPVFNVSGSKLLSLKYVHIYSGTNLNNRAILNNGNLSLENVTIFEKSNIIGTGTTLTNLGNVNIIGNVSILSYP
jgi:photosystem II stability/assembly factor-like uncharacterized protein